MRAYLPECFADTLLMEFFGIPRRKIDHASGISRVAKAMKHHQQNYHKKVLGLIDNDAKNVPAYFDNFEIIEQNKQMVFKKSPDFKHYLIVLNPAMEGWVLDCAQTSNINPIDYNLLENAKLLHKITELTNIKSNPNYRSFLQAIKTAENEYFNLFQSWLDQFKE